MTTEQNDKLDAIYNKIITDNKLKIIWENPKPNSMLTTTVTVNHDFSQYNCIIVTTLGHYQLNNLYVHMFRCPTNNSGVGIAATNAGIGYQRILKITSSKLTITPNTSNGNYESYTVPVKIYGLTLDDTSIFNF